MTTLNLDGCEKIINISCKNFNEFIEAIKSLEKTNFIFLSIYKDRVTGIIRITGCLGVDDAKPKKG